MMEKNERRSYAWFERRRRTEALDLAQEQISKALSTATWLAKTVACMSQEKKEEALQHIESLMREEEEIDTLRTQVFKELSKGTALFAEYREDIMNIVNRLDKLADYVKDAARCIRILSDSKIPKELWQNIGSSTSTLVECASALRNSIENIVSDPIASLEGARNVEKIESTIDKNYLAAKSLLIKNADNMNSGSMIIFDHLVEFIESAADMCADTADYIVILASRT
jgi:predicted phosphate transport protein (TIGR00153 family)